MLMEQSCAGIPGRRAAPGGPAPVAIRMQHYPRFTTKRSGQMHNHGVDADDEIQFADAVTELHDIWRADVLGADLSRVFLSRSPLQGVKLNPITFEPLQKLCRDGPSLVPVSDFPDQSNRESPAPDL